MSTPSESIEHDSSLEELDESPSSASADRSGASAGVARFGRWGRRAGAAAFLFFFLKGLAWLVVPALLAYWGTTR